MNDEKKITRKQFVTKTEISATEILISKKNKARIRQAEHHFIIPINWCLVDWKVYITVYLIYYAP